MIKICDKSLLKPLNLLSENSTKSSCYQDLRKRIKSILIHECQHKSTRINTSQHKYDTNQHESDTSQHESTRVRHESTRIKLVRRESTLVRHQSIRINTSPTRVNTSQLDQETIIVYRSFSW